MHIKAQSHKNNGSIKSVTILDLNLFSQTHVQRNNSIT